MGMQGYTGVYKGIHGYKWVYMGVQGYLTIIPRARMGYESVTHEAEG